MPCPHFNITITQRSKNQSAVAGAAYQSGETLFSEYDQKRKAYSEKRGIVYTEIMLPANAPPEDERFDMMSQAYEAEQKELEAEVIRLQKEIEVQETQIQNIEKFIQKSSQYVGIEGLTPYVLHELVKAIYVDAPDKSSGKRRQHIHIRYDGLGFIPLNELLTSEKA